MVGLGLSLKIQDGIGIGKYDIPLISGVQVSRHWIFQRNGLL